MLEMRLREQGDGLGVLDHESETIGRIGGIERHIGSSGLEYGEQAMIISKLRSMQMATCRSGPTPRSQMNVPGGWRGGSVLHS